MSLEQRVSLKAKVRYSCRHKIQFAHCVLLTEATAVGWFRLLQLFYLSMFFPFLWVGGYEYQTQLHLKRICYV